MPYFRIPRFTPAAGKLFNRSRFIDGTYPTYFAPGQTPNVVNQNPPSYTAPTGWRPRGSLLTPPQVVWFTLAPITGPYQETFINGIYCVWSKTTFNPPSPAGPTPGSIMPWPDGTFVTATYQYYFSDGYILSESVTFNSGTAFSGNLNFTAYPAPVSIYSTPLYPSGYQPPQDIANSDYIAVISGDISVIRCDLTDPPSPPSFILNYGSVSNFVRPSFEAWWQLCQAALVTAYDVTVPDVMLEESGSLTGVFNDVIGRLAQLRPGQTWARLNTISSPAILNGETYMFNPCVSFEIAPPVPPGFFGVDFLHIHALAASIGGADPDQLNITAPTCMASTASNQQLAAAFKQFWRYQAWVYGPDGQYEMFPPVPLITNAYPSAPGDVSTGTEPTEISTWVVDNLLNTANNPVVQTTNDNRINIINGMNQYLQALISNTVVALKTEVANVSKCGVSYKGTQSDIGSADQVMLAIANHFNFDPQTGYDLPPPSG